MSLNIYAFLVHLNLVLRNQEISDNELLDHLFQHDRFPIFIKQIREMRPLTLTAPEMSRFWLPLSEAVELVNFALEHGKQGDIFIRKAASSTAGATVTEAPGAQRRVLEFDASETKEFEGIDFS